MTVQASGIIKIQDLATEFGGVAPHSMSEYYLDGDYVTGDNTPPAGVDISTNFYEISNRFVIDTTSSDYTGPYDVGEVQVSHVGGGNIAIGQKVTASTTYTNDTPVAGVQILDSTGTILLKSWIFNASTGSGEAWYTINAQITGSSTIGFPATLAQANAYSYATVTTSTSVTKFSYTSGTGSSFTGAAGGIGDYWKTNIATLGDAQIAQEGAKYYAYRETSGSARYSGTFMFGPNYNFSGGERIRVIHLLTGRSNYPQNPDDSLYIGIM